MNKQTNTEARQENRKALPKFLLILLGALVVGGAFGFGITRMDSVGSLTAALAAAGEWFSFYGAPWLLCALAVALPAAVLPLYRSAVKLTAGWDGEDDEVSDRADKKLSVALWLASMGEIVSFVLLTAVYADFRGFIDRLDRLFFVPVGAFLVIFVECILFQQRIVDLTKRIYPEKKGSVYDMRFRKKWLDSCDEAERLLIGKCAYKAFAAVNGVCCALDVVLILTAMGLGTGFLPVLAVSIVWGVAQTVYCMEGVRLSAHHGAAL